VAHKHLLVQSAAREKILHGAMALVDAMRVTLGRKSKCVLIEKRYNHANRARDIQQPPDVRTSCA
jgi:hypothetical protein